MNRYKLGALLGLFSLGMALTFWEIATYGGCPQIATTYGGAVQLGVVNPYASPTAGYAVGQGVQDEAAEERIANKVVAKLLAAAAQGGGTATPGGPQALAATGQFSIAEARCVKCHATNGATPNQKAIDWLDMTAGVGSLDPQTKLDMIASVIDGRMPKGKPLEPQDLGNFVGQMAGARSAPGYIAPVQSDEAAPEPPAAP